VTDRRRDSTAALRTAALILALLFALALGLSSLAPLVPRFVAQFGISTVQAGALSSVTTLIMVIASVPIGLGVDRLGVRLLTTAGTGLFVASCLLQGLATSYWMLLAGRTALGVADTMLWTATLVWLTQLELSARGRAIALGGSMTVMSAGFAGGPLFVGATADASGLAMPFAVMAGLAGIIALMLLRSSERPHAGVGDPPRLLATVRAARRDRRVLTALLLLVTTGGLIVSNSLLVPLELHDNGLSTGQIGAVLSVVGLVGVLVGVVVNQLGERAAQPTVGAACTAWIGLVALLPATSHSTIAILVFLALSGWASTSVITITYPLGAEGALQAGLARGAIIGGLNTAWALSASVAPLAGGALAQSLGFGAAWLAIAATQIAGSLVVFRLALRRPTRPTQLLAP